MSPVGQQLNSKNFLYNGRRPAAELQGPHISFSASKHGRPSVGACEASKGTFHGTIESDGHKEVQSGGWLGDSDDTRDEVEPRAGTRGSCKAHERREDVEEGCRDCCWHHPTSGGEGWRVCHMIYYTGCRDTEILVSGIKVL
ncbi:hypothetical protein BS17DRAFT_541590 [Gyrodon lividus]|nr:hypothetical protein BS17DRAFT_541590 [Gyrodon lividus]